MKNITENKRAKTFTVQTTAGVKTYKTRKGAENFAAKHACKIDIPMIVTANTYFWTSGGSASSRRYNEQRREGEIQNFINQLAAIPTITVQGEYRETCGNVYKSMTYEIRKNDEWRVTNLTGLIGECARWGVELVK